MSEQQQFWHWATFGVTPSTVGRLQQHRRRNNNNINVKQVTSSTKRIKQHRRNSIVILNDDSHTSSQSTPSPSSPSLTWHIRMNSKPQLSSMEHSNLEVEVQKNEAGEDITRRCDSDTYFEDEYFEGADILRTPPESYFVFEDKNDSDIDDDGDYDDDDRVDQLTNFRLSMAGLKSSPRQQLHNESQSRSTDSCSGAGSTGVSLTDDHRDELHSHLYSSVLETVRNRLVECIPCIKDEMISRAIIHAFADSTVDRRQPLYSTADESLDSCNGQDDDDHEQRILDNQQYNDKHQNEVNLLKKAYDFMKHNHRTQNQRFEHKKNLQITTKMEDFLQSILNDVFCQIRMEEITSSDDVVRSLISVMSILQVQIINSSDASPVYVLNDTILLHGLPTSTTRTDLRQQLSIFGEIESVAIATPTAIGETDHQHQDRFCRHSGFGMCRFLHEDSIRCIMNQQRTIVLFDDIQPTISILGGASGGRVYNSNHTVTKTLKGQATTAANFKPVDGSMNCVKSGRLLYSI